MNSKPAIELRIVSKTLKSNRWTIERFRSKFSSVAIEIINILLHTAGIGYSKLLEGQFLEN
jgi:hypothetical protein